MAARKQGVTDADQVLRNGRIYTVDPSNPWAEALAIRVGKLTFVGTDEEVQAAIGAGTSVIDS